jgi:hypothetical protein
MSDGCIINFVIGVVVAYIYFHEEDAPRGKPLKGSSNDLLVYRVETLSKSFRKKYHPAEPSTVSSSSNLTKTFSKNRTRPLIPAANSPSKIS